jgi:NitT/TauT family transport system substrate-binding protein
MTAYRTLIAAPLVALVALAQPARAAEMENTTIALPAVALIFSSVYIAQDAGIFKKDGLEVKEQVITGIAAANAVISGSQDFSSSSGVTITRAAAHHQSLIAIADTFDRSGFWVVISKKAVDERHFDAKAPLAERAKLMKGLRFAVGAINAIPHAYLKLIAKIGGLDGERDITVAGMSPPDQVGAIERGAIDGFSGGPPVTDEVLLKNEAVILANGTDSDPIDPPWLTHVAANVVLTRPQFCADHKSICMKMGHAMVDASKFMHEHPEEAMKLLAKRVNVTDPKVLAQAYKETLAATPLSPALDAKMLSVADDMNIQAGFMKADERVKSYDGLFTNDYLK